MAIVELFLSRSEAYLGCMDFVTVSSLLPAHG